MKIIYLLSMTRGNLNQDQDLLVDQIQTCDNDAIVLPFTRIWPLKYLNLETDSVSRNALARDAITSAEDARIWAAQEYEKLAEEIRSQIDEAVYILDYDDLLLEKEANPLSLYSVMLLDRLIETEETMCYTENGKQGNIILSLGGIREVPIPFLPRSVKQSYLLGIRNLSRKANASYRDAIDRYFNERCSSFIGVCDTWPTGEEHCITSILS